LISALERVFEEGGAFFDITGLSSIVLSGAEQPFDASTSGLDGRMDGSELGALDLTRAELVTLSACETGVGTEFAGDGVHALSRSFLEAGARRVVSSLWQVPSEPTSRLFIDLYTTYASPKKEVPLPRAFREAKLAAIARARASGVQHSSFLWAAFPMVVTR
ncbi:MAG: CHAT domain-containing protein, partial [Myxococcota bacterium]|nr:CHAT domain-containing protein [Myxococcota bacterium]